MPSTHPRGRTRSSRALYRRLALLGTIFAAALAGAAPATAAPLAGVQAHLLWGSVDAAELDRQLALASDAHANLLRVDLSWSSLEPSAKGQYSSWYLGKVDNVVSKAEARGLKILFTFTTTPCWASSAPDTLKQSCAGSWWDRDVQNYAPTRSSDYADALAFMVRRYGSRVRAWELWNEPNASSFFKAPDPAAAYASLVKAAYPAAKAASASATIVAGSLMHSDYAFTSALYQHGIKGNFDAFSVHPYSDDRSPLDAGDDRWIKGSFIRGVPAVRDVMERNGDAKPMWLTEFGWSTSTVRNSDAWRNGVDEATQAAYLTQAMEQMRKWTYVDAGVWFKLVDTSSSTTDTVANFGLVRYSRTLKPAYAAFRAAADAIASGAPVTSTPVPAPAPTPVPTTGDTTAPTTSPTTAPTTGTTEPTTGTTEPTTGTGGSTPTTGRKKTPKALRVITVSATRVRGRLVVRGRARRARQVVVSVYSGRRGGFATRPVRQMRLAVKRDGRFGARVASASGRMLVRASAPGARAVKRVVQRG